MNYVKHTTDDTGNVVIGDLLKDNIPALIIVVLSGIFFLSLVFLLSFHIRLVRMMGNLLVSY